MTTANFSLQSLFDAQAARSPQAEAVWFEGAALSYAQLGARADTLAHHLRALGVGANDRVGLCLPRGLDMAAAVLGVLKAGGAYVPLDPAYPAERLRVMLENAQPRVLLTHTDLQASLPPSDHTLLLDTFDWQGRAASAPDDHTRPEQLAYVIYTSGSTGTPKGVALGHGALSNLIAWQVGDSPLGVGDRTLQFASLSFDVSFQEMFATWASGGTLILISENLRRDPRGLLRLIREQRVARLFLPFVALQQLADALRPEEDAPLSLKEIMTAGEQLQITPKIAAFFAKSQGCALHNQYGPSEAHVVTQYTLAGPPASWPALPPIGKAIANTQTYVLNEQMQPVPAGEEGELFLGGTCLAQGYLHRPDLTAQKFVPSPFAEDARLYKTGDRARVLPGGDIEFLGRADGQVKIRGFRIEIGEIEHALSQHPHVRQCAVTVQGEGMDKALAAFVVTDGMVDTADLRRGLAQSLPPYMVPASFTTLDTLPLTPSGKVDRRALPMPDKAAIPAPATPVSAAALTSAISQIWQGLLHVTPGPDDSFFDIGGTSLHMTQAQQALTDLLGWEPEITTLFQYPTVSSLAKRLGVAAPQPAAAQEAHSGPSPDTNAVAIVGMAGRFPNAPSVDRFWHNITHGEEAITRFSDDELRAAGVPEELIANPDYVKARAVLDNADLFDAAFFSMTPREAEVTDPQHRVFLECAWEALEHAGYSPETSAHAIGVYAGLSWNTYLLHHLLADRRAVEALTHTHQVGHYPILVGNDKDYLPTRVSYKLNLTGPSVSVQTGCSTSLVAVCQAVQALLAGQCGMALAGGVSLSFPQTRGYLYQEGGMVSPDGHCRVFDAQAAGTVFGGGAGVVVLKRLADAIADRDTIYAVIKGAALNNDGAHKVSYTAPGVDGQADVIARAQSLAQTPPDTITYVEAHGTGTPLGDPIEVAALTQAFRRGTDKTQYCALGSVKAHIGHLEAAAGVTGLIKTSLALTHKVLPPTLHFQSPNPRIDFAQSPFFVSNELTPWASDNAPRRAGVSSFGVGGTNAHVVLEEAPVPTPGSVSRPWQVLAISAKTPSARDRMAANLASHLAHHPEADIADTAYTLATGRRTFPYRQVVVCRDGAEAAALLAAPDPKRGLQAKTSRRDTPVAFLFPGQGAQQVGMGRELYHAEQVYKDTIDTCADILAPLLGLDLRDILFPAPGNEEDAERRLARTEITQPALFVTEYALAQLWLSWGLAPAAMLGHSVGEYVAACLAGVFSLPDALLVLSARARLMQSLPPGAMLAVRLPEADVLPLLGDTLSLAAVNSPSGCVVSGPSDAVAALQSLLESRQAACKRLNTSHAFHSGMMEPILAPFMEVVASVPRHAPRIPYVSNVTADWITPSQAASPQYWADHLRRCVRFADGVGFLLSQPDAPLLLEVGPGQTLTALARQHPARSADHPVLASLDTERGRMDEAAALAHGLGRLWLHGVSLNWNRVYADQGRRRIALPTYPFERTRHWVEPVHSSRVPAAVSAGPAVSAADAPHPAPDFHSPAPDLGTLMTNIPAPPAASSGRTARILAQLTTTLHEISGVPVGALDPQASFLDLGFDSLFLTQASQAFGAQFGVKVTFRHLLEDLPTLSDLAAYMDEQLPPDALPAAPAPPAAAAAAPAAPQMPAAAPSLPVLSAPASPVAPAYPARTDDGLICSVVGTPLQSAGSAAGTPLQSAGSAAGTPLQSAGSAAGSIERILEQQLQVMSQQIALLGGRGELRSPPRPNSGEPEGRVPVSTGEPGPVNPTPPELGAGGRSAPPEQRRVRASSGASLPAEIPAVEAKPFGPFKPIEKGLKGTLTARQQSHLDGLIARTVALTPGSKEYTAKHRPHLSDPRVVAGFKSAWKEMVYPIVATHSAGSRIWDVDGNEWLDLTMGFGVNLFGHAPQFVADAVRKQLDTGMEIGPQSPIVGDIARRVCALVGMERATFCNTGSEAVMAAIRVARTVTGRRKIVYFTGDYHGTFDEVLARANHVNGELKSAPIAPGIPPGMVEDTLILDYGTPESLALVAEHAHELAAVLVEPVQSRRPDLQPREFLHALRRITEEAGAALIFDEVITGFRVHPGGAQAVFGVRADMATYGKVIGGGMPFGILTGKAEYLDAFDGGQWQYGDDSFPQVGVTFFAGTFVRHPLALAAASAVLTHLETHGPGLQEALNARTEAFVARVNTFSELRGVPMRLANFGSLFYFKFAPELKWASLFYYELRALGVHIWEGRPCFLSTAHTDDDIDRAVNLFAQAICAMQDGGFFPDPPADAPSAPGGTTPLATSHPHPARPVTLPLTTAQREVWLAAQMGVGASCALIESISLDLRGPLDAGALQSAVQCLPARHDALRTTFAPDGETQTVHPHAGMDVPLVDLSMGLPADNEAAFHDLLAQEARTPFDLERGPVVRAQIVRRSEEWHTLVFSAHHLVCDGWSAGVLLLELGQLYEAALTGAKAKLPAPMLLGEYVANHLAQEQTPEGAETLAWWQAQLTPLPAPVCWPSDRPRPASPTYAGAMATHPLSADLTACLRKLGSKNGCTLVAALFAGYAAFLRRLTGQDEFVVGLPAAGQNSLDNGQLVAHCVNLLPVPVRMRPEVSFLDLLAQVKRGLFDAYDHQELTFSRLLPALPGARDGGRTPLIATTFNVDRMPPGLSFGPLAWDVRTNPRAFYQFDFSLNIVETGPGLLIECHYGTDLFDAGTVARWLGHLETVLAAIADDPECAVSRLPLLSEAERQTLLVEWNRTETDFPRDQTVHALFAQQARQTPDAVALAFGSDTLTYAQVDARADRLARRLHARGIGAGAIVGVCLSRSPNMIVALLGVLKAGAAFLPLDAACPPERLAFMVQDARASLILTETTLAHCLPDGVPLLCLHGDDDAALPSMNVELPPATADSLAYVMYTSGSTGAPKGVLIPHRAIVRLVRNTDYADFGPAQVFLQMAPLAFDASTFEVWGALLNGGRLALMPAGAPTLQEIGEAIARHKVTTLWLTAGLFQAFVDDNLEALRPLKQLLAGGDVLSLPHVSKVRAALPHVQIINGYGPTECTTFACCHPVQDSDLARPSLPIGRPIANTTAYVLDECLQPVPIGLEGELYLGGAGLALGYLGRPDLTAQKFISSPFAKGARLYQTGDRARFLPTGDIEFLGRADGQVKLRGYRIEPGEIEHALSQHPHVRQCAICVQGEGMDKALAAFVVADGTVDTADLRRSLAQSLPPYMVPASFQTLDTLPLTPNGKVDRRALQARSSAPAALPLPAPTDGLEQRLALLWQEVLGVTAIGPDDDFFDMGGHSLLALRLLVKVEGQFGQRLPLPALFQAPTVARMARMLRDKAPSVKSSDILIPLQPQGTKTPLFCIHHIDGNVVCYRELAQFLGKDQPVYGLQAPALSGDAAPFVRVEDMAARFVHEIVSACPQGPVNLCGYSFGGVAALEIAQQLRARGREVCLLALLDTYAPRAFQEDLFDKSALQRLPGHLHHWKLLGAREKMHYVADRVREGLAGGGKSPTALLAEATEQGFLPQTMRAINAASLQAQIAYTPRPYAGRTLLLRATELSVFENSEPALWWGETFTSGLEIQDVPGAHLEILRAPYVSTLARHLAAALDSCL